ncbi:MULTISPECIES: hypothetical protein [Trichocoleus]|uniref:Uncharacterized protein n=1 Tax=Trichocoleus desertorum GB2-A4 TaxID=2933944 RepID=A0ABV0JB51_9CYAN|nr:hypothetical protein [Trichocoleus sp. FACHB-46]MBD1863240.1 hypothetical protein [Trichocoleus sp. FACHB-46]
MSLIAAIETVFHNPPIPFEPAKHSLKAWATYCLRDRGFKVVYAQNADFAIEPRTGDKLYFKVSQSEPEAEGTCGWIVWNSSTSQATVIPPASA